MIIVQMNSDELSALVKNAVRKAINEIPAHPTQTEPEDLLTVRGAAEFLKLSVPTIYTRISKGTIPVMKQGKRCYFSKAELIDWLKAGRKKTKAEINLEAELYLDKKRVIKSQQHEK